MANKFSVVLAVAIFGISAATAQVMPWEMEERTDDWAVLRHAQFVENTENNGQSINVLFYGDSITEGWQWDHSGQEVFEQYYAHLGTTNYAIGSDQTQHLNWRISNGEVEGLNPKLIVLMIGTNNLGYSDNDVVAGILSNVQILRSKMPNSKLLLLGVLPRGDWSGFNERVHYINSQISTVADGRNIIFFDMFDTFAPGDQLVAAYYQADLLHLAPDGYWAWAEAMNPIFNEMLNSYN